MVIGLSDSCLSYMSESKSTVDQNNLSLMLHFLVRLLAILSGYTLLTNIGVDSCQLVTNTMRYQLSTLLSIKLCRHFYHMRETYKRYRLSLPLTSIIVIQYSPMNKYEYSIIVMVIVYSANYSWIK